MNAREAGGSKRVNSPFTTDPAFYKATAGKHSPTKTPELRRIRINMAKTEKDNLFDYTEDSIRSLDWREHIRLRPGMLYR